MALFYVETALKADAHLTGFFIKKRKRKQRQRLHLGEAPALAGNVRLRTCGLAL